MTKIQTYNHHLWDHGISQGYCVDNTLYISGQFSHNTEGSFVGEGDIQAQVLQTLENLDTVLAQFGATKSNLAYVEIYLTRAQEHGEAAIELFKQYVGEHRPAGSMIGVSYLAFPEQWVEIRAVAKI
ncbi:RidA family protein [Paenibacillus silvae]|uniref:RidA family protein n=1 Tax=Paenibacillus silvae TaxID=1325358 RepID=UPI002004CC73|nr:RidA family protein [Paenibacillus silvae]MCK6077687.1 RidA family protein [Paenibacillus silvae]MCK6151887.1 RidA family protein [Paenibacillus silvae]MCK6270571.1 RidA family protein [Paenibacillus silvae]